MKRSKKKLGAPSEHEALHVADNLCCSILRACTSMIDLAALDPLKLHHNTHEILEACQRLHDKLAAAHAKFQDGGLH